MSSSHINQAENNISKQCNKSKKIMHDFPKKIVNKKEKTIKDDKSLP